MFPQTIEALFSIFAVHLEVQILCCTIWIYVAKKNSTIASGGFCFKCKYSSYMDSKQVSQWENLIFGAHTVVDPSVLCGISPLAVSGFCSLDWF